MKKFFYLILLSYLYLVFNIEYDLANGVEKTFNLTSSQTYNFYIPITQLQTAKYNITINNLDTLPFSYINIYEYSSRNNSSYIAYSYHHFSTSIKNNQLIVNHDYMATRYSVSYITLVISLTSNVKKYVN